MAALGTPVLYDPATAATKALSTLVAMTALDTTNARITFTGPANGIVMARIAAGSKGSFTTPAVLFGVLDGATVRGRQQTLVIPGRNESASSIRPHEAAFLITGLTSGTSYTFDAAYSVDVVSASVTLGWGGPNNTTATDAYGALSFEIWETLGLLAGVNYDPAVAVAKTTATSTVMTALDTTNLRLAFTVPTSGKVLVRMRGVSSGSATVFPSLMFGILEGATLRMRRPAQAVLQQAGTLAASDRIIHECTGLVSGLTPGANLTWDAAMGVEFNATATNLQYGGPNDTTTNNAWGGFAYEIWTA
jgi:hypothetical protein